MKEPYGAMTAKEFDALRPKEQFYAVWSEGSLEKRTKEWLTIYTDSDDWSGPYTLRRLFRQYLHAYAHSLKIRAQYDQQKSYSEVLESLT